MPTLDTTRINDALEGTQFHNKLHHFTTVDSTNTRALEDAQAGAETGQVYIADEQTAGRGRGGHTWYSEPDRGLYMTVLVKPALQSNEVLTLSMLTGLTATEAVAEATGVRLIDLRWPNDLVIGSRPARKAGGILIEAASTPTGELRHAAIGIGINLNQLNFPRELEAVATSLRNELGFFVEREEVAIHFLQHMDTELRRIDPNDKGVIALGGGIFQRFEKASTWVRGKYVQVDEDDGYTGITAGLDETGLLRVECTDGTVRTVRHGGVREL
jgi:BirA family biotin operon repressor/biotin-[acetyl-CoA-carboxylase] ligase